MLSPPHQQLLDRYRHRMITLTRIARRIGTEENPHFVVAEVGGDFAANCDDAGEEFLQIDPQDETKEAWVIPLDTGGMVTILAATHPEGVAPLLTRAAGTIGVFIVTGDDAPAVTIIDSASLVVEHGRA
jgi:hypothetical protein